MKSTDSHIENKVRQYFQPEHLELINESHMHAGPALDSHFKLILVSELFHDKSAVKRHQEVYRLLADELSGPVHALALHLYSPEEWRAKEEQFPASPQCMGGSKKSL